MPCRTGLHESPSRWSPTPERCLQHWSAAVHSIQITPSAIQNTSCHHQHSSTWPHTSSIWLPDCDHAASCNHSPLRSSSCDLETQQTQIRNRIWKKYRESSRLRSIIQKQHEKYFRVLLFRMSQSLKALARLRTDVRSIYYIKHPFCCQPPFQAVCIFVHIPISFTSVPAWSRKYLQSVNFLFHHRNNQKDCFRCFRLFGHPKIFCVNGLWKGHFHDKTDRRNPISILTRLFVCQKRALRTASFLLGKVCDLDGIRCSAVGHSRTHFHSVLHIFWKCAILYLTIQFADH